MRRNALPLAAAITAAVVTVPLVALSGAGAAAAGTAAVRMDRPGCLTMTRTGSNSGRLTVIGAHQATMLSVTKLRSGSRTLAVVRRKPSCTAKVAAGHRYQLTLRYESSRAAALITYYRDSVGHWHQLARATTLPRRAHWSSVAVQAPSLPVQATSLSFGVALAGTGSVTVESMMLRDVPRTTAHPKATPTSSASATTAPVTTAPATTAPSPSATAPSGRVVQVSTAAQLTSALAGATPGDTITLADGTYHGNFTAKVPATAANPIRLTGSRSAILDGGNVSTGYALHLDGADYWQVDGFSVGDAQKAIVLDATSHATLSNLNIHHTGDELVLLRNYSRNDVVTGNEIYDSGLVTPGYGEGVYVGLAISNWSSAGQSRTGGQPDTSDGVTISGNDIHDTTAENVDIKEGTSGGTISGNTFNAHGLSGANYADSWVDIAGNGYTVSGNTGTNPGGALLDGYQTHVQASGWGRLNVFSANISAVNASGYGFDIQTSGTGNVVRTDNTVTGAGKGVSNIPLS